MTNSFYQTIKALESLDQFQGSNEELLKVREGLAEPSRIRTTPGDCAIITALLPMECPVYFTEKTACSSIKTAEFKLIELRWTGVSFKAWLSLADRKIYM